MMKTKALLILFLGLIFSGCEKDDDASPSSGGTPAASWSFSAKVNGNLVHADSLLAGLHIDTSLGIPLRSFAISALCDTQDIGCGFADTVNSTTPAVGNYNSAVSSASLSYIHMSDTINEYFSFGSPLAQFAITYVDAVNQKVSGYFSGIVVGDVTGDTIVITNGVFSNVHYDVW